MESSSKPDTPFGNIALTFSGGGFRAAAYSLGALSYLNEINFTHGGTGRDETSLLDKVTYISSTSGGSFTNALYSAYTHSGKSFKEIYEKLLADLHGQKLLDQVFTILEDDKEWIGPGKTKQRNLINAFAIVYDREIFGGETFGVFWNKTHRKDLEICINSTEFYRGLSFRFQTEGDNNPKQVIGNKYLHFNTKEIETIKSLKLADMVAASSCFPAGFEPIVYPGDFGYNNNGKQLSVPELNKAMLYEDYQEEINPIVKSYGFMDGGITDNQGLYSAMLADKKRRKRVKPTPFDLIIVTDVTSYFMDEYKASIEKNKPAWRTRRPEYFLEKVKKGVRTGIRAMNMALIASLIVFLSTFAGILGFENQFLRIISAFVCGISFLTLFLIMFVGRKPLFKWLLKNRHRVEDDGFINDLAKRKPFISEKVTTSLIRFLRYSRFSLIEQLITSRISSLLSMVLDINLKQTRRLIYEMFYDGPMWENRRVPNFIYELSSYNKISRTNRFNSEYRLKWQATDADKELLLGNCDKLNSIAEDARTMGTTLWFDEKDVTDNRLKSIVSTGQFTTCCNLLEYVISLERKGLDFDNEIQNPLNLMKGKLISDFIHFKSDPFYLFNNYL